MQQKPTDQDDAESFSEGKSKRRNTQVVLASLCLHAWQFHMTPSGGGWLESADADALAAQQQTTSSSDATIMIIGMGFTAGLD